MSKYANRTDRHQSEHVFTRFGVKPHIHADFLRTHGAVAQLAEQQPFKLEVQGSIPCRLTCLASKRSVARARVCARGTSRLSVQPNGWARLPHETASEGTRQVIDA